MAQTKLQSPKQLIVTELQGLYYGLATMREFFSQTLITKVKCPYTRDFLQEAGTLVGAAHHCVRCAFQDLNAEPQERICPFLTGIQLDLQKELRDADQTLVSVEALVLKSLTETCLYFQGILQTTAQLAMHCAYHDAYDLCREAQSVLDDVMERAEELLVESLFLREVDEQVELAL